MTIKDDINVDYPKSGDDRREAFEIALRDMGLWSAVSSVSWSAIKAEARKKLWINEKPIPQIAT